MGNAIYESVVARLSLLAPMLSRTQVDIGLSRVGADAFHVTALQMVQALTRHILPRIQEITQKAASLDTFNVAQLVTDSGRNVIAISKNFSLITGAQYSAAGGFRELVGRIVPIVVEFDHNDLAIREVLINGRTLMVTSSLERDEDGNVARIITHVSDQTLRQKLWSEVSRIHDELEAQVARRTAELQISREALSRREEHIRAILENLPVVVYDRLPDGRVSYFSPNLTSLWGYRPDEFLDDPEFWTSLVHPDDRDEFRRRSGSSDPREYRFISRVTNNYIWILDVASIKKDTTGARQRFCGIMADITQQKELQAQVFFSQKMEAMGALAAGFANDFLNHLTGITTNMELIGRKAGVEVEGESRDVLRAAANCSELVRSILTFGRSLQEGLKVCQPNRIVDECVNLLRGALSQQVQVKVIMNPEVWNIRADEAQILQVLVNLTLNARDAMPEGGTLMIETDNHAIDDGYCLRNPDARPGRCVMISVGDTGTGIEPEVLPRIFEPFFTTKAPGLNFGMGLVSTAGIVKAHHGWIEVLTHPGAGSNFRVFLPRFEDTGLDNFAEDRPAVLVAGDSESIRKMSRKVLEQAGFHVLLAEDAAEVSKLFQQYRRRIEAVLLDFSHSAKTAIQLCREIRGLDAEVRILLTTGYATDLLPAQEQGARLLSKPFSATELVDSIRKP